MTVVQPVTIFSLTVPQAVLAAPQGEGSLSPAPVVGGNPSGAPAAGAQGNTGAPAGGAAPAGQSGGQGGEGAGGTQQPAGGGQGAAPSSPCGADQLLIFVPFLLIFYFLLIRPQQKQEKKRREMLTAMKSGDLVVTNGGIHGEIVEVSERTVTVKYGSEASQRFTLERSAIARIITQDGEQDISAPKG
jgi:preprotein translocase subunit YajC